MRLKGRGPEEEDEDYEDEDEDEDDDAVEKEFGIIDGQGKKYSSLREMVLGED